MTRNYMTTWRARRALLVELCECEQGPRIAYDKGCARCEQIDLDRYRDERTSSALRRQLAHHDLVSMADLAEACGVTEEQAASAMRSLIANGDVEKVGASNQTEYRAMKHRAMKQRRAA